MAVEIKKGLEFNAIQKYLVKRYLQTGSIYKAVALEPSLTELTSVSNYHKIIRKWGLCNKETTSGRSPVSLGGTLEVLLTKAKTAGKLQSVYRYICNRSWLAQSRNDFLPSHSAANKAYNSSLSDKPFVDATVLVVVSPEDRSQILIGNDITVVRYEEDGTSYTTQTLPSTHSNPLEGGYYRVVRVLQQEVLSELAVRDPGLVERLGYQDNFTRNLVGQNTSYLCNMQVGHIDARVYMFQLPQQLAANVSSYRLEGLKFVDVDILANQDAIWSTNRPGVVEIARAYRHFLDGIPVESKQKAELNIVLQKLHGSH